MIPEHLDPYPDGAFVVLGEDRLSCKDARVLAARLVDAVLLAEKWDERNTREEWARSACMGKRRARG